MVILSLGVPEAFAATIVETPPNTAASETTPRARGATTAAVDFFVGFDAVLMAVPRYPHVEFVSRTTILQKYSLIDQRSRDLSPYMTFDVQPYVWTWVVPVHTRRARPNGRALLAIRSLELDDANLVSLRSLWALGDVEFDGLVFFE